MAGFVHGSYSFTDKDPLIDYVRTAIQDSGKTISQIADESHVGIGTIYGWVYGKTYKPQSYTLQKVLLVCGYELVIAKSGTANVISATISSPKSSNVVKYRKRA